MRNRDLTITDDIHEVDRAHILTNLHDNTMLSISYLLLLSSATVICTLGLLLDSPAVVIGGMIISPLMWPLMKISAGISLARKSFITQALMLLGISILVSLASSYLISLVSPLKSLNTEIIARSQPTLLDIIIALAAGIVAALAIVEKKISTNLAGVAIATSLMPPLCVIGIGLALLQPQVALGGFLLFLANVVSIIFVGIFVFRIVGITTHAEGRLQKEGIVFVSIMLVLTALPLFIFLQNFSFTAQAYTKTESILRSSLATFSSDIYLENVKTHLEKLEPDGREGIRVEADILIPEGYLLDFQQKESIIRALEQELGKDVTLNLRVQSSIELQSESDLALKEVRNKLTKSLQTEITKVNKSLRSDTVSIKKDKNENWVVDALLRGDPSVRFTEAQRSSIERALSAQIEKPVTLLVEIIPRLHLKSQPDIIIETITSDTRAYFQDRFEDISIIELSATKTEEGYLVNMFITVPPKFELTDDDVNTLKLVLQAKYQDDFTFMIDQVKKSSRQY